MHSSVNVNAHNYSYSLPSNFIIMCLVYMCMYYLIIMYVFLFKLTILIQNLHNDDLTTCLWHLNRWHFVKSSNVMEKMIHGSLQPPFFSFLFSYTPLSLGVFVISWIIHIIVCLLPCFVGVFFFPLYPIVLWVFLSYNTYYGSSFFVFCCFWLFFSLFSFLYNVLLSSNAFLYYVELTHTIVALSYSWHSCDKNLIIMWRF